VGRNLQDMERWMSALLAQRIYISLCCVSLGCSLKSAQLKIKGRVVGKISLPSSFKAGTCHETFEASPEIPHHRLPHL
jgi:hypothetical protein